MSAIVVALSAGAAGLASGALGEVGREAYGALKQAVLRFVPPSDIEKLEQKPGSESRQEVLAEELADVGKAEDPDLARLAKVLIIALKETSMVGGTTGISLKDIEAANIHLEQIAASGTGVRGEGWKLSGDIKISGVEAAEPSPGKLTRR